MIMFNEKIKKSFLDISSPPFRGKHSIILPIVLFAIKKILSKKKALCAL